jgi:hypothetical protein
MSDTIRQREQDEERDAVLDALLAEMIGAESPPDVTARVLASLERLDAAASMSASWADEPSPESADVDVHLGNGHAHRNGAALNGAALNGAASSPNSNFVSRATSRATAAYVRRRRSDKWVELFVAVGVIAGCVLIVSLTMRPDVPVVEHDKKTPSNTETIATPNDPKSPPLNNQNASNKPQSPAHEENPVIDPYIADSLPKNPSIPADNRAPRVPERSVAVDGPNSKHGTPVRPGTRPSDPEVIAAIDRAIRQRWSAATITPSVRATETEWLRRVSLGVLGRIPKLDEVEAFLGDRSPKKREAIVEQLLSSNQYADEFARNWTNVYTEALLGHTAGDLATDKTNRAGLQQYLRRSFLENKSYDKLTNELLTATGSTNPDAADFNGATNFLVDKLDASGVQATVKTAEIFLGVQVQCTQCHNHPFNDWKQGRFWELNAFFRQAKAIGDLAAVSTPGASNEPKSADQNLMAAGKARIANQDFHGEGDKRDDDAEVYYEERNGKLKAAYPVFLDGTAISRNGDIGEVNRREVLAKLVTASPWFAEAAVNRVWSHFFGHGFTTPIDDMGPHNPPTHPELVDKLSREFAASGYDIKSLIRWITLSEAYALSSKPSRDNQHDDPTAGYAPLFSRYYLRQMRADQLYESLAAASGEMRPPAASEPSMPESFAAFASLSDESYAERERDKGAWVRQFVIAYRTDECDECSLFVGSIPQTLAMMNGEMTAEATDADRSSLLNKIAKAPISEARKVQQLFLAALARNPTPGEQTAARRLISAHGKDVASGLEDLWWALLNSNEFILDR